VGFGRGHKRGNNFYMSMLERMFLNETSRQFESNLVQTILAGREFKFVQMKGQVLFKGGIPENHKSAKIG
jgi:hypothetical protein